MAHENSGLDENAKWVSMGVTDDASQYRTMLRVDPTTKRLKVDALITAGFGSQTAITDNEAVDAADTGVLILGTDGTNYQVLATNSSGHLLVDLQDTSVTVDSEFPTAAAITDNFDNPTTTSVMAMGMVYDGSKWDRALGDSTNGLLVNLGSNNDVSLNAGTNAIGKLVSNSGVDIGDVDILSVIPGTGATNLGKARSDAAGSTDSGVALFGIYNDADGVLSESDGDYVPLSLTHFKEVRTRDQRAIDIANCNASTDYTVLGNDTANLANSTNHVFGTGAITFDKVNGAANTVFAGVSKTFTAINISEIFEAGGFVGLGAYLPSLTNVVNVFLRIGTDASNYNCWTWAASDLTAASWLNLRKSAAQPDYSKSAGNGWNTAAIAYVAFGVEFSGETNTLAGIVIDHVHIVGGRVTASDNSTAITSTVTTPNINIQRVGGVATASGAGAVTSGTLRTTLASDDPAVASLGSLDNAVDGNYLNVNMNLAGTDAPTGAGTESGVLRVTIANDSTGLISVDDNGGALTVDGSVTATLAAETTKVIGTVNIAAAQTIAVTNAGTFVTQVNGDALTALQLIDNLAVAVDGNYLNVNANIAGTDIVGGAGAVAAGVQRMTLASDDPAVTALQIIDDWDDSNYCNVNINVAGTDVAGNNGAASAQTLRVTVANDSTGVIGLNAGTNAVGKLLPPDVDVTAHTNYARKYYTNAGAVTDGIIWSPASGKRWHVVTMYIQISAAATITLEDDKGAGDDPVFKGEYAANSGVVLQFPEKYPMASGEDAADLTITTSAGNVYVTCVGYEI